MKIKTTPRGFQIARFKDYNGRDCSIQESSLATKNCIWLGADNLGIVEFSSDKGWVEHPEFDESTIGHHFVGNNRMQLTRKQVIKLLPLLISFAETGTIK